MTDKELATIELNLIDRMNNVRDIFYSISSDLVDYMDE